MTNTIFKIRHSVVAFFIIKRNIQNTKHNISKVTFHENKLLFLSDYHGVIICS